MSVKKVDVLILGGGISGLTAALLLAKHGKKVTVLEQYAKPGGYLHSFKRAGHIFDTGAHYIGSLAPAQPFHTLMNYLGVYNKELFTPLDPQGFDRFHFPDGSIEFPVGYEALTAKLCQEFPEEKVAILTFLNKIQTTVKNFPTYVWSDETDPQVEMQAVNTPLTEVVEPLTTNKKLKSLFYAYCFHHGVKPSEAPFGFHAIVFDSVVTGPYGLTHGGDAVTEHYVKRLNSLGGEVLLKHQVEEIQVVDRLAKKIRCTNGHEFEAEWVVSSLHPKSTFQFLNDRSFFTPAFKARMDDLKESSGVFGLYAMAARQAVTPLKNEFYFKSADPDLIFKEHRPEEEPEFVFAAPAERNSPTTAELCPVSFLCIADASWFKNFENTTYGRRPTEYNEFKKQLAEKSLKLVSRYQPSLSQSITKEWTSTPITNRHFNGSPEGSAYGLYHSIQNTGGRAIGPRTKVLNLLLTGQNTLFPGLLGASVAAVRTCGHILGIKPLLREINAARTTKMELQ